MKKIIKNISSNFEKKINENFKNINYLENAILNKQIYKFSCFNSSQNQKLFKILDKNIFLDKNSKKVFLQILELIKKEFFLENTKNYLDIFLYQTNDILEYKFREDIFSNLNFNFDKLKINKFFQNILDFNEKIIFPKTIYCLDKNFVDFLFENYKINAFFIKIDEIEEILNSGLEDFIIIGDENLILDCEFFLIKDFKKLLNGILIKNNLESISNFISFFEFLDKDLEFILNKINKILKKELNILEINFQKLKNILFDKKEEKIKNLSNKISNLEINLKQINLDLKQIILNEKLSFSGEELLEVLNLEDINSFKDKISSKLKKQIILEEKKLIDNLKTDNLKINVNYLFENKTYPLKIDKEILYDLEKQIENLHNQLEFETFLELGNFNLNYIKQFWDFIYVFDFLYSIFNFTKKYNLKYPKISNNLKIIGGKNLFIKNASSINYGLGIDKILDTKLNFEKISVLTGANSGGKTSLLEMFLQTQILTSLGLGIKAELNSSIRHFDKVVYLKKFSGNNGSGAFEETIRNLIEILNDKSSKLILIDEFESITEPVYAAKILIQFLIQINKYNNFCISVSHLGEEIQSYLLENKIDKIRIDGICAKGLDENSNLITNHQPDFYQLGKSTPELILKKILNDKKFWKNKDKKMFNFLNI